MDFVEHLKKHSEMPVEQLRVVQSLRELNPQSIRLGIVFIFAAWSGPAVAAFERLTKILSSIETSKLDLIVLNTDDLDREQNLPTWAETRGGWGETIWIRDGQPVAQLRLGKPVHDEEIISHTRCLIA